MSLIGIIKCSQVEQLVSSVLLGDSSRNISNGSASLNSTSKSSPNAGGAGAGKDAQQDVAVFVGVSIHGPQHPRNELVRLPSPMHRFCHNTRMVRPQQHGLTCACVSRGLQIWPVQFYSSVDGVVTDHMRTLVSAEDLARDQSERWDHTEMDTSPPAST